MPVVFSPYKSAVVVVVVLVAGGAVVAGAGCAQSQPPPKGGGSFEACPIDPERFTLVEEGDVPLVITSTHAGDSLPQGCDAGSGALRELGARSCTPSLDQVCESGPCRSGGPDGKARQLTFTVVDDVAACLGGRPSLALTEIRRSIVDMNRDADDTGGLRCAMEDPSTRPYWEAFHRSVESLVARAVDAGGDNALLIDLHTYNSLPAAPSPAMMIGTGDPVGLTLPHVGANDRDLGVLFGRNGLRIALLDGLRSVDPRAQVYPTGPEASLEGLFNGRYVVRRYSRRVDDDTKNAGPAIDSVQLETSSGLRDDVDDTAQAIAAAICSTFGARLRSTGTDTSP